MSCTVTAKTLEQDAAKWRKSVVESIENFALYIHGNCIETIIATSFREHASSFQFEAAFRFSTPQVKEKVRTETIRMALGNNGFATVTDNWNLGSSILGLDEDRRHASYEDLRARTLDSSRPGIWHMVLDCAPLKRLGSAAGLTEAAGSAPRHGPAGGRRDGASADVVLRADPRGGGRLRVSAPQGPPSAAVAASCDSRLKPEYNTASGPRTYGSGPTTGTRSQTTCYVRRGTGRVVY